jgi:hypothetical protein
MSTYICVIDEGDRIVSVSHNWLSFAQENQAAESCHPAKVIKEPIWNFIDGLETTHLYEIIIAKVRSKKRTVTLPYRCDAPDRRRYLELRIAPVPQEHIEFASRIIGEEPRDRVKLLQSGDPRSDELIKMCSMCKKVELSGDNCAKVEVAVVTLRLFEENKLPQISHGFCPE